MNEIDVYNNKINIDRLFEKIENRGYECKKRVICDYLPDNIDESIINNLWPEIKKIIFESNNEQKLQEFVLNCLSKGVIPDEILETMDEKL